MLHSYSYTLKDRHLNTLLMDRSNSTLNVNYIQVQEMDVINGVLFNVLLIVFKLVVHPLLVLTGVSTNVINTAVFFRMGLSDGVTQNFFILSISDCLIATISLFSGISYISLRIIRAYVGYGNSEIKAQIIYWSTFLAILFPQYLSLTTTVVIAVVRCCCVVFPLKVKYLITTSRQLALIITLSGTCTITLFYIFVGTYTAYVHNPLTNSSIAHNKGVKWSLLTVVNSVAFSGSFIIVIICVIILSVSLRKASKFRGRSSTGASSTRDNKDPVDGKSKERHRDARVIRTVVLVSVVFIVCNIPLMVYYSLKILFEGLSPSGKYKNANQVCIMVCEAFTLLNLILNMFIYVSYNSRYRTTLLAMVGKNKSQEKKKC